MDFVDWLNKQLDIRDWTQADLVESARAHGYDITPSQISRVLSRQKEAGLNATIAIAHGLGVSREEAFRARGWLLVEPTEIINPDVDPRIGRLMEQLNDFPPEIRDSMVSSVSSMIAAVRRALSVS
jgi:hypothetical protein